MSLRLIISVCLLYKTGTFRLCCPCIQPLVLSLLLECFTLQPTTCCKTNCHFRTLTKQLESPSVPPSPPPVPIVTCSPFHRCQTCWPVSWGWWEPRRPAGSLCPSPVGGQAALSLTKISSLCAIPAKPCWIFPKGADLFLVLVVQGGRESRAGRRSHHAARVLLPLRLFGGGDLGEGTVAARLPQAQPPRRRRLILALLLHLGRRHLSRRLLSRLRRKEEESAR